MLKLVSTQKDGVCYPLLVDTKYTVGRKQADIVLSDDQSVSRAHAEVLVEHPAGNINEPLLTPVLNLTDVGSKFGTFATEDNIKAKTSVNARESVTLSVGEKIRFGLQWNEFVVDYTPLVMTSSSYKAQPEFKSKIVKLGGHFVNEWSGLITHVLMESITLTIKAVCALLSAKPIVTPKYVEDLVAAFEKGKAPPEAKKYVPPITEKGMTQLDETLFYPNTARTTIFAGKTFLFCTSKHLKKLALAVEVGGGTAKLVTEALGENVKSDEFIIMGHPLDAAAGEQDARTKAVLDTYKKAGKRLIADSEIGLAAVYTSIDKHCNPRCSMVNAVLPQIPTQTQSSLGNSVPIVPETQDLDSSNLSGTGDTSINVVNETVVKQEREKESSFGSSRSDPQAAAARGEKRNVETGDSSSKKRPATEDLAKPIAKRVKEGSSSKEACGGSLLKSKPNSHRALNSLFNFSSSEDEAEDDVDVVPASQPMEDEEAEVGLLKVVDVRNLQSLTSTQESSTVEPAKDDDDYVFRVPASPELPNPGTDMINTVTTSIMNAKTVPCSSNLEETTIQELNKNGKRLTSNSNTCKLNESTTEVVSSKKRRRDDGDINALSVNTKKITLNSKNEPVKQQAGNACSRLPFIKKALVNKDKSFDLSFLETSSSNQSSNKKNFKTFKKVLPKFIELESSKCQENVKEVSIDTNVRDAPSFKFIPYDYYPGSGHYFGQKSSAERNMSEEFDPYLSTEDLMGRPRVQKSRDDPKLIRSNGVQPGPSTSKANQSSKPALRSSPRKKGPVMKFPALIAASATPPVPMIPSDDEDEDDIWSFNR